MKARISPQIPEQILTYAIRKEDRSRLSDLLRSLSLRERPVLPQEEEKAVGFLAGLPGASETPAQEPAPAEAASYDAAKREGVILLCGLSQPRMNAFLRALRRAGITPIRAALTQTNREWSFRSLLMALSQEHDAFAAAQNAQKKPEA